MSQSVVLCNRKDRMLTQNTALYCCCDCCGNYNPCDHRLIQIADYFLNGKRRLILACELDERLGELGGITTL